MDSSVANRLNKLLGLSQPITISKSSTNYTVVSFEHSGISPKHLADIVLPILRKYDVLAQEEEIKRAAKGRRDAETFWTEWMGDLSFVSRLQSHGYACVLWELAESEVRAAIDADNTRRLKAYEEYRTFCEQGTAKPIPEASK